MHRSVRRFSRAERLVHQTTLALMVICLATAAAIYFGPLAAAIGRRHLVATVHEWSGILLPAPFLLGLASRALRLDVRRLNRFTSTDTRWLRNAFTRKPHDHLVPGKFNAGQKVFAAWLAGAIVVMVATGLLLWFKFSLSGIPRAGVIAVHDTLAFAILVALAGHAYKAFTTRAGGPGSR
ncbi:cytochrome b/b6 domain-containing protein [Kribbella sp. NPDC051770]|uniref:cytochrome b/b6 domain-containing protein n=1 Tax=Kribbella sp. NPDC051770 TaxID=3155413 RepID=UPI00341E73FE